MDLRLYISRFVVCWKFGAAVLEQCPCCRLKHNLLFYFTSYVLNMFPTLIYPSSGACDFAVELPHRLCSVKTEGFGVSVNLWCLVVCVWCDVLCRFVVVGRCIFIYIDRFLLCFAITVFSRV